MPDESVEVKMARMEEKLDTIGASVTGIESRMRNLERAAWAALGIAGALGATTGSIASLLGGGS